MTDVHDARAWLGSARAIAVLAGAGMSTASGIQDFRGPQGLWTQQPEAQRLFTVDAYLADPEVRRTSWRNRSDHPAWTAKPNAGHHALAALEAAGRLVSVATQNIDGLQQAAGSRRVLELHGTIRETVCLTCGDRQPTSAALDRVTAGDLDPACLVCGGILKTATISFGQQLDRRVLLAATGAAQSCDVYLAVGSTLTVHPAAGLCQVAVDHGARLVIVNDAQTPYDEIADVRVDGRIEQVLPDILSAAVTTPSS
jgi:NAD-dependent deacetylase